MKSQRGIATACDGALRRFGSIGYEAFGIVNLRCFRQRKKERRASAFFRFHPDPAPKAFHNLLADRQPDPASGPIVAVQPLEGFKDLKLILRRNTGTVIRAREKPHLALICNPDVDPWNC